VELLDGPETVRDWVRGSRGAKRVKLSA